MDLYNLLKKEKENVLIKRLERSGVVDFKEQLDEYKRGKQMASKVVGSKLADGLKSNLQNVLAKKSSLKLPLNKDKTE